MATVVATWRSNSPLVDTDGRRLSKSGTTVTSCWTTGVLATTTAPATHSAEPATAVRRYRTPDSIASQVSVAV